MSSTQEIKTSTAAKEQLVKNPKPQSKAGGKVESSESGKKRDDDERNNDSDGTTQGSSPASPNRRKRKRCRKGLDKKYECPEEGCDKSYSRAEHLYRHQLNHKPKQIYHCDFPGCPRNFVRHDLLVRHRERHSVRSGPDRKDAAVSGIFNAEARGIKPPESGYGTYGQGSTPTSPVYAQPGGYDLGVNTSTSGMEYQNYVKSESENTPYTHSHQSQASRQEHYIYSNHPLHEKSDQDPYYHTEERQHHYASPPTNHYPHQSPPLHALDGQGRYKNDSLPTSPVYESRQNPAGAMLDIPISASTRAQPLSRVNSDSRPSLMRSETSNGVPNDSPLTEHSLPTFEGDNFNRSPVAMAENFAAWLFNDSQSGRAKYHSAGLSGDLNSPSHLNVPLHAQHAMSVTNLLTQEPGPVIISERKRQRILKLIHDRFNESIGGPVAGLKDWLFKGDLNHPAHVLSLQSFRTYIGSYWFHFSDQMPILHQPTFSADNTPLLLLIAIIAIGASNLDKIHGVEVTEAGAQFATFLAWHLRGEIFLHEDFRPPAKLWVLQSLLLLEVYEKMFSSRTLHERAQIHHATTISLLRRGSALLGGADDDLEQDSERTKLAVPNTTIDPGWYRWIVKESTKRIAFATFIVDSTHAAMFSHTATMVAHEMRIPLPCDETLWSASSAADLTALLHIKSLNFLEALKLTLNERPVRTNVFGRTALMAGLLNVSFHLSQRDIQVRSLGAIGGKDPWRGLLTKAYDFWESNWDSEASPERKRVQIPQSRFSSSEAENIFESRVVLRHLAHIVFNADIIQCQIFAGASRLLGRKVTSREAENAAKRMRETWAPSAGAREAVFYSLRFLRQVLTPGLAPGAQLPPPTWRAGDEYNPRDDYLLNRPWVLFFASLVVWSYGFALDGKLNALVDLSTKAAKETDMRLFMERVGGIEKPDDLLTLKDKNACAGMLTIMSEQMKRCRWELMHEGAELLGNCVNKLING